MISDIVAELEAQLAAIGRPNFLAVAPSISAYLHGMPGTRKRLNALLRDWSETRPELAGEWARLTELLAQREAFEREVAITTATAKRHHDRVTALCGARIAEVLRAGPTGTRALEAAKLWHESPAWSLTLVGDPGTGKSIAAAWCLRQTLEMGGRVAWIRATEAATASLYGDQAVARAQVARGADLLVIDDLGAQIDTSAFRSWLEDVVGARYANADRTIITSNLNGEEFKKRTGGRITDRLREGKVIGLKEESMRRRPA